MQELRAHIIASGTDGADTRLFTVFHRQAAFENV